MIYAFFEIIGFLSVAAILGFFLGWLMRGLSGGKRAERQWRSLVEIERKKAERVEAELKRYRAENEALREQIRGLESAGDEEEEATSVEESTENANPSATPGAPPADRLASQEDRISEIARRHLGDRSIDDDLKRIRGIGPVLERLLKEKGITSYRQVALLDADEIQDVAEAIGSFPGRIERDNWIQSAREQHVLKYGSEP